ncbi:MAG: hypothetical protein JO108_13040 [Acidobacteriaceae bacterium]|nr:hypothetical protein [Acidobacteriaceae bacterium]
MEHAPHLEQWLEWTYEGNARERRLAVETLAGNPDLLNEDPWLACAVGDISVIRKALSADAGWANRPGGPLGMPPLVAVTHSMLILEPEFGESILHSARFLLAHGADVNCSWTNPKWPDSPLSALYGAAGRTHHELMLKILLDAGADPNDNESLYHSLESRGSTCTRLLLDRGARVDGTNAIARAIDYGKLEDLQLMLQHDGVARERPWIHHAILRGRPFEYVTTLVRAGADLRANDRDGNSLYRYAQVHGRSDVVEILHAAGIEEPLTEEEQFVAACARGDYASARHIREALPDIFSRLTCRQLQALPEQAGTGNERAVRTMLGLGWPVDIKAAWSATALNLAVYRGDASMVHRLLDSGADWRIEHGFGDNVWGTLAHASRDDIEDPSAPRNYLGCAKALIAHNVPTPDRKYKFSDELDAYLEQIRFA